MKIRIMVAFRQLNNGAIHIMWKLNTDKHWYKGKWYDWLNDYSFLQPPRLTLEARLNVIQKELI